MVRKSSAVMSMHIFSLTSSAKSISQALAWHTTSRSRGFTNCERSQKLSGSGTRKTVSGANHTYEALKDAIPDGLAILRKGGPDSEVEAVALTKDGCANRDEQEKRSFTPWFRPS